MERRERYLAELNRLQKGRARRGDLAGMALVEQEIHQVSTGGRAEVLKGRCGFSRLHRAQRHFERDSQLILAHLPRVSSAPTNASLFSRLLDRIFGAGLAQGEATALQ
jgi:hypothetical protein